MRFFKIYQFNNYLFAETRHLTAILDQSRNYWVSHGMAHVRPRQNVPRMPARRFSEGANRRPIRIAAARARRAMSDVGTVFCFCRQGFFGQMIRCDAPYCRIVWFHTECVGLIGDNIPTAEEEWFCGECRPQ